MNSILNLVGRRAALATVLACSSAVMWAATKGPDAGGYTATDQTVYSFADISGASGGASILAGTDDGTAVLTLPFVFRFYGQPYALACVSTNGALYFVPSAGACSGFDADFANTDITAAPVPNDRPAVLPFWTDLTFQVPGAGAVLYQTLGVAPARKFVVQWNNAYPQGSPNPVTFQLILSEAGHEIRFQYKTVALGASNPSHNGGHATIGIRNGASVTNGQHLQWSVNAPVLADQTAILFSGADSTAPNITAAATPSRLWPPDGKPRSVTVTGTITDSGSGVDTSSARFSVIDEYGTAQPNGAVTVAPNGTYSFSVSLVSDRHGNDADGRLYTIRITAKDNAGNEGSGSALVIVPHDQGK